MISDFKTNFVSAFSALTLLVGWQERHPDCKTEWCAGVVICLVHIYDLHQLKSTEILQYVAIFF